MELAESTWNENFDSGERCQQTLGVAVWRKWQQVTQFVASKVQNSLYERYTPTFRKSDDIRRLNVESKFRLGLRVEKIERESISS